MANVTHQQCYLYLRCWDLAFAPSPTGDYVGLWNNGQTLTYMAGLLGASLGFGT